MNFRIIGKERFYKILEEIGGKKKEFCTKSIPINLGGGFDKVWKRWRYFYLEEENIPFAMYKSLSSIILPKIYEDRLEELAEIVSQSTLSVDNYTTDKIDSSRPFIINRYKRTGMLQETYNQKNIIVETGQYRIVDRMWGDEFRFWVYLEESKYYKENYVYWDGILDYNVSIDEVKMKKELIRIIWTDQSTLQMQSPKSITPWSISKREDG